MACAAAARLNPLPDCGCCKDWVSHLEANGFQVKVHDIGNAAARARLRVPEKRGSCHTAQVGGYALEGHVPSRDLQRPLKERTKAVGLAVPGMPVDSPGMDGPVYGGRQDARTRMTCCSCWRTATRVSIRLIQQACCRRPRRSHHEILLTIFLSHCHASGSQNGGQSRMPVRRHGVTLMPLGPVPTRTVATTLRSLTSSTDTELA